MAMEGDRRGGRSPLVRVVATVFPSGGGPDHSPYNGCGDSEHLLTFAGDALTSRAASRASVRAAHCRP
jgi:hypothetical protein